MSKDTETKIKDIENKFSLNAEEKITLCNLLHKRANKERSNVDAIVQRMHQNIGLSKPSKEQILSGSILKVFDVEHVSCFSSLTAFRDCYKTGILTKRAKRVLLKLSMKPKRRCCTTVATP